MKQIKRARCQIWDFHGGENSPNRFLFNYQDTKEIYAWFEFLTETVMKNSIIWDICCEILWKSNDFSEEHIVSISGTDVLDKQESSMKQTARRSLKIDATYSSAKFVDSYRTPRHPVLFYCFDFSSVLTMVAIWSSEAPVEFYRTTRRYIPEDGTLEIKLNSCHVLRAFVLGSCDRNES
jgi:hypothetical protein